MILLRPTLGALTLVTGLAATGVAGGSHSSDDPQPPAWEDLHIGGELAVRLHANFDRLEEEKYQPHKVFLTLEQSGNWPGDTEGRTVLALTLLAQATGRQPRHLDAILELFPQKMNPRGFFGDIPPDGTADEQQLSSQGWVLRALCESWLRNRNPEVLAMIRRMVDNLILPTKGLHAVYPIDPAKREHGGGAMGERQKIQDNWVLSTDTGCDFIFLDGVVQARQVTGDARLDPLIQEIIARFLEVDLVGIKAQTHATLTGLRALCRYYESTGDPRLLDAVRLRFDLYKRHGMTENYENYNWFGRPTHTEPCAVHDSFLVALALWRFTGEIGYLSDAHHIYYNAIGATQRSNGGFGCNSCSGAGDPCLGMKVFEAHWCCTMRGGEGLSRAAQAAYHTRGRRIYASFFTDSTATLRFGERFVVLQQQSHYPFEGRVRWRVIRSNLDFTPELAIPLFDYTENHRVRVGGKPVDCRRDGPWLILEQPLDPGNVIELDFDLHKYLREPVNEHTIPGVKSLRYGPLVLGLPGGDCADTSPVLSGNPADLRRADDGTFTLGGQALVPVWHLLDPRLDSESLKRAILFKTGDR